MPLNGYHSGMNDSASDTAPLDWGLLQVFLALEGTRSLGRAAAQLGSSQPTLSRRLADLEAALGQSLFERTARGLVPTAAGLALLPAAQRMQQEALRLQRVADGHARSVAGTVRVTASELVSAYLLMPVLRTLRERHPQIQIELVPSDGEEDLLARDADIALRMYRPREASLTVRRLADVALGLFAHADYLAAHGPVRLDNADTHHWIGLDRSETLLRNFAAAGKPVTRDFFGLRSDSSLINWHAAANGLGIAVGLQAVAAQTPDMVRVLSDVPIPASPMWLAVHREMRGTPRLRIVFKAIATALSAA